MGNFKGVISDMLVGSGELTAQEFASALSFAGPPGYEPFRNLIAGDYEFQKAVFKSIQDATGGSTPRLLSLKMSIDVPDIFDRGTAVANASGPVTVPFNRPFYAVGEVVCTEKGGAVVAVPRVSNVTLTSFDVELIDVNGTRVAGTVSWSAKGY